MTIHKFQGGTFNEVVYEYQRTHSLPLLYVALSRVTSIEGLYIVPKDNDNRFYHGRKNDTSIISLQDEFRRLSLNTLSTIGRTILDFMNDRKKFSMVTFNCQSLRKHISDLRGPVIDSSHILFLSETWSNDDQILTSQILIVLRNLSVKMLDHQEWQFIRNQMMSRI